jgi:hypothetical protein
MGKLVSDPVPLLYDGSPWLAGMVGNVARMRRGHAESGL